MKEEINSPLPPQAQLGRPILLTPDTLIGERREEKIENEKRVGEMAKIKKREHEKRREQSRQNRPEGDSTEDDRTELGTQTQILDKFGQTSLRYHTKKFYHKHNNRQITKCTNGHTY